MTSKWGPIYWNYIHAVSIYYPDNPTKKNKEDHLQLIYKFMDTVPCGDCQNEIKLLITDKNLWTALESKDKIVKYLFNIHNIINKRLKKKQIRLVDFYKKYSFNDSTNLFGLIKLNKIKTIIIVILFLIITALLVKIYRK